MLLELYSPFSFRFAFKWKIAVTAFLIKKKRKSGGLDKSNILEIKNPTSQTPFV